MILMSRRLSSLYEPFHCFYDLFCRCISLPCTCTVLVFVSGKLLHFGHFISHLNQTKKLLANDQKKQSPSWLLCIFFLRQIDCTSAKYFIKWCRSCFLYVPKEMCTVSHLHHMGDVQWICILFSDSSGRELCAALGIQDSFFFLGTITCIVSYRITGPAEMSLYI